MRLWVSFLVFLIAAPVWAEEVSCGPDGPWHDPAMEYHLDDLLALIEARLDWEEGKPREDGPGDAERVAAAVGAWQRLAEPHDGRAGNPEARWWLGHLMMEGKAGFAADAWGALAFLLPAAEAGHLEAMTQAGRILVRDENAEKLTPDAAALPAPAKGRACLKRAAWLGNRRAQELLGFVSAPQEDRTRRLIAASALSLAPSASITFSLSRLKEGHAMHLIQRLLRHCAQCGDARCQMKYAGFMGKYYPETFTPRNVMIWGMRAASGGNEKALEIIESNRPPEEGGLWKGLEDEANNWAPERCY